MTLVRHKDGRFGHIADPAVHRAAINPAQGFVWVDTKGGANPNEYDLYQWRIADLVVEPPPGRRFFKQTYVVEVLTEGEIGDCLSLAQIDAVMTEGDGVGRLLSQDVEALTPEQCAKLCHEFGSDPGFFQMDDAGSDVAD